MKQIEDEVPPNSFKQLERLLASTSMATPGRGASAAPRGRITSDLTSWESSLFRLYTANWGQGQERQRLFVLHHE